MQEGAQLLVTAQNLTASDEKITCSFALKENAVEYFELKKVIGAFAPTLFNVIKELPV